MTPFYHDGYCSLYLGDCHELAHDLSPVDLVLSDPPYGISCQTNYRRAHHTRSKYAIGRKTWAPIEGDHNPFDPSPWLDYPRVILWGANCYSERLPMGTWLVWDRRFATGKSFFPSHGEVAWMRGGHGVRIFAQVWQGVCRGQLHISEYGPKGGSLSHHPNQKPVALMAWCIEQAGRDIHTVLDPFAGSGSTLIAAKSIGLQAIGIECVEAYAETAAKRLERTEPEGACDGL